MESIQQNVSKEMCRQGNNEANYEIFIRQL